MTSETPRRQPRPSIPKESGLLQRARQFLKDHFPGQTPRLVVSYSGGRDSLALLLVLSELRRLDQCNLSVVHVDHALREESAEDASKAVEVGRQVGVKVAVWRPQRPLLETFPGRGVEDAARSYRYGALARVVEEAGADAIAVGHHARDQAETILLHLLRGSGLAGLGGMAPDAVLPVPGSVSGAEMRVIRPFLHEPPEALAEVVQLSGLPVIEDPSNTSPDFRRNRVRHELLPLLEDIAPGATGRLVALADIADEDDQALDNVSLLFLDRSLDGETLLWESLKGAPQGLRRRVVRHWLLRFTEADELSLDRVDAVIALASGSEGGKRVEIGGGWIVCLRSGRLDIVPPGKNR
jgi:tRNA(Ile)-lysidine synthase